jgi:peptide chain release factor 1
MQIIETYQDHSNKLATITETKELIKLSKQQKILQIKYDLAVKIQSLEKSIESNNELIEILDNNEAEMLELAKSDNLEKTQELQKAEIELLSYLAPTDPKDDEDIYLEIRAGAGGDESSLFAAEMTRMYKYLCDNLGFNLKIVSFSENSVGGYKEVIAEIKGAGAYSWFKYEGGVHRVQRVPETEKQGRVHTSTISVAIMPIVENDTEFKLDMKDVEIMIAMASGNGGQSVNTTYSAVKMRHIPTGIEAQSHEKNQIQNRENSLKILTARVFDFHERQRLEKEYAERKDQVGQADRSEKIRTYNFPQDRFTDHRYNHNWNQLPTILNGGIYQIIQDIRSFEAENNLKNISKNL